MRKAPCLGRVALGISQPRRPHQNLRREREIPLPSRREALQHDRMYRQGAVKHPAIAHSHNQARAHPKPDGGGDQESATRRRSCATTGGMPTCSFLSMHGSSRPATQSEISACQVEITLGGHLLVGEAHAQPPKIGATNQASSRTRRDKDAKAPPSGCPRATLTYRGGVLS